MAAEVFVKERMGVGMESVASGRIRWFNYIIMFIFRY
jgi:hypothetical protein